MKMIQNNAELQARIAQCKRGIITREELMAVCTLEQWMIAGAETINCVSEEPAIPQGWANLDDVTL